MNNKEAYLAMVNFLEKYYNRTGSDDIGALLGSMILLDDEETMDPAVWIDWIDAINNTKE